MSSSGDFRAAVRGRGGQVALYLIAALVVLLLLTMLNVDAFIAVRTKNRLQNAGDAAALAAARKQGELINEIGRLNVQHILAAIEPPAPHRGNPCAELVLRQRRLALTGPVDALRAANHAAKNNGMEVNEGFSDILSEHVNVIRTVYAGARGEGDPYPESYPGAWNEYADAIANAIAEGLATGPDNVEFYGTAAGHLLLNRMFYEAIAGKNWCWFHFYAIDALRNYRTYHDWEPLPFRQENSFDNSELFSLHLRFARAALNQVLKPEEIRDIVERFGGRRLSLDAIVRAPALSDPGETWVWFDTGTWSRWFNGRSLVDEERGYFPLRGEVKEEYNVRGCAAICRCVAKIEATAVQLSTSHAWSAAAKPFGTLLNASGEADVVTCFGEFVLPCMDAVRLVPLDSVGGQNLATADFNWVDHLRHHLGPYLIWGPTGRDCFYCRQLSHWEREIFRRQGLIWLDLHSGDCLRPPPPGGISGGGTFHGH